MRPLILFSSFIALTSSSAFSQSSNLYSSKFEINANIGHYIPLVNSKNQNDILTSLSTATCNQIALNFFSVDYFFSKHWGAECNIVILPLPDNTTQFSKALNADLSNEYFVNNVTTNKGPNYTADAMNTHVVLGLVYRFEKGKWFVQPKALLGGMSGFNSNGDASLKKKNANDIYLINYNTAKNETSWFTYGLGATFGYKFSKTFSLAFDAKAMMAHSKYNYTKSITEVSTSSLSSSENISSNSNFLNLGLGLGVKIMFGNRKNQ